MKFDVGKIAAFLWKNSDKLINGFKAIKSIFKKKEKKDENI